MLITSNCGHAYIVIFLLIDIVFDHIVRKNSSEQVKPCAINHTTTQPHHIKLWPCIHLISLPFSSSSSILSCRFDHIVRKNSPEQVKPCAINHTTAQPHHIKLRPCIHLILMPFSSSSSTLSCKFDHLVEHNAMNPIRPYWSYWSNISCILSYQ